MSAMNVDDKNARQTGDGQPSAARVTEKDNHPAACETTKDNHPAAFEATKDMSSGTCETSKEMPSDARIMRMRQLSDLLDRASRAYYQEADEIMSNYEYDRLYDELVSLEKETGMVLTGSPTMRVGYEVLSELPKERHEAPMLSLDKTKDVEALKEFAGEHDTLVSWKLDGLTVVLTYVDGQLEKAVTRGNGEVGEVITGNARVFRNIPLRIPFAGELILRGEAVISYADFDRINEQIEDVDARYKNPRNLCSGSVRQLNNAVTAQRNVRFFAFSLVRAAYPSTAGPETDYELPDFQNSRRVQLEWLKQQGFDVVEYRIANALTMEETVRYFADRVSSNEIPSDGLVLLYDNIAYGQSLGRTAKFPRDSIAFKWQDEIRETILREVEWSPSRTGLINPVAIFDPVELEGTTVSRASVHNISIVRSLKLGIGDHITVYKANMIIPQIAENLTCSDTLEIPSVCPACQGKAVIRTVNETSTLVCENEKCSARRIKAFTLLVSRDALNIDGLSEATLEKLIAHGCIRTDADLFRLDRHRETICSMEGFGEKSCSNLLESIERARHTTLQRLLYGLGIPGIGTANARMICRHFSDDFPAIRRADAQDFCAIDGVGEVMAQALVRFFEDPDNAERIDRLLEQLILEKPENAPEQSGQGVLLAGKTFVITGTVEHFANRNELKAFIEARGGKVTGSVTKKTDYLINNDTASSSAKNKKARELSIPVLSEEDFLNMVKGGM